MLVLRVNSEVNLQEYAPKLKDLISDTWTIGSHDIKLIFLWGGSNTVACYWDSQVSLMSSTAAWAWHTL
ncbi:hypothetical protein VNO78_22880 [Psophocarpus tetragonolobus]|uniref:Uncharacterized protein n=1 Tax=Psophocarpus tetragonolobus TaxID=3891 RepID=A0AAN9S2C1_PSOTE